MRTIIACIWLAASAWAQEANSGLEVRANISTAAIVSSQLADPPRSGAPVAAGMRAMVYPTWKLNQSWAISGTVQIHTRPYFTEEFLTQGRGLRSDVLQLHLRLAILEEQFGGYSSGAALLRIWILPPSV